VRYKEAVSVWKKECDAVREAKKKFAAQKPTQEKLEKPISRPKPAVVAVESSDNEEEDDNEQLE